MSEPTAAASHEQDVDMLDIKGFLLDFFHSFKRLWWIVALIIVLAMLASYFRVSRRYSPLYTAEATVSVELVNGGS